MGLFDFFKDFNLNAVIRNQKAYGPPKRFLNTILNKLQEQSFSFRILVENEGRLKIECDFIKYLFRIDFIYFPEYIQVTFSPSVIPKVSKCTYDVTDVYDTVMAYIYFMDLNITSEHPVKEKRSENKELISETSLNKNKKDRVEIEYYENGKLKVETPFVDNKRNGLQIEYYENGNIEHETPYVNGKIHGITRYYYGKDHKEWRSEENYINGESIPPLFIYDKNGKLYAESPMWTGIEKIYYESGKLKSEIPRVDGKYHGIGIFYNVKGELEKKVKYVKNNQV